MWLSAFFEIWGSQSGVAEDSNFLRCHTVLNSSILHVTLYRDIPVFWGVCHTEWRYSSVLGCHAVSWNSIVVGCHAESWHSRVMGCHALSRNWTQCAYRTVRTISFKQPKLSLVLKSMWDFWWTKWHWDESFSEDFGFPLSKTMLHTYIHLHAPVTRRAISKAWGPSKNNTLSEIRTQWVKKHIHLVLKD